MRELAEQWMTVVVVAHEIGFAREVADSVAFSTAVWSSSRGRRTSSWCTPNMSEQRSSFRRC